MTKIIPRNTTSPTSKSSKSEVFSTTGDGQTSEGINVYQGDREFFVYLKNGWERVHEGQQIPRKLFLRAKTRASTMPCDEVCICKNYRFEKIFFFFFSN